MIMGVLSHHIHRFYIHLRGWDNIRISGIRVYLTTLSITGETNISPPSNFFFFLFFLKRPDKIIMSKEIKLFQ